MASNPDRSWVSDVRPRTGLSCSAWAVPSGGRDAQCVTLVSYIATSPLLRSVEQRFDLPSKQRLSFAAWASHGLIVEDSVAPAMALVRFRRAVHLGFEAPSQPHQVQRRTARPTWLVAQYFGASGAGNKV